MKPAIIFSLGILVLYSSGWSNNWRRAAPVRANEHFAAARNSKIDTLLIPDDTIPHVKIPRSAIRVPQEHSPQPSKIRILYESDFNAQDGVGPKDVKLKWAGLFNSKNKPDSFYVKPAKLKITPEHSEFDDKDSVKTGWRLTCDNPDNSVIFITGMKNVVNGPIKKGLYAPRLYYAGQKLEFKYYGVTYTLYSTGRKTAGRIYNYKLFLLANVKGRVFNQLLVSQRPDVSLGSNGDMGEIIEIKFAGDLDGDHIPDFIIQRSGFPYGITCLYLSKPAGDKAILKLVSLFGVSD